MSAITPESLGSREFRKSYGLRFAYLAGAMYRGIASRELVVAMGRAGFMGYLGTGGLELQEIEAGIRRIQMDLGAERSYGANLLCNLDDPHLEAQTVDLFLRCGVRFVEAAAYVQMTPSLVRWRLSGLRREANGRIARGHRVLAKVSRPEVATAFMTPAPESIVKSLVDSAKLTTAQAELGRLVPMADEICVEADSAGHTDQGVALVLMPAMILLRDRIMASYRYDEKIRVGAAGGIGTPHAAAANFIMGADFILTGSINQCTVEAATSDVVKDLLQTLEVQDTAYAPAGDMFEVGAKVQVAKRGLFFAARANKLYELYQRHNSIDEIDPKTRQQIEERYFRQTFEDVWRETRDYYLRVHPEKLTATETNPKRKMAAIFKWYFALTTRLALEGVEDRKIDFQIHCGPAMGTFNQWVKGTELESWRNRHVAEIGTRIMRETANLLGERTGKLLELSSLSD